MEKMMLNNLMMILIFISITACNIDSKFFPREAVAEAKKVWTFISFNVPEKEGGFEDYYYFGLVNEELLKKIKSNEVKDGLIFMEKVKYWNTEDVIESYEDEIYSDEFAFRIEHIVKFELVKKEPVDGFKYSDDGEVVEEVEILDEI